MHFGILGKKIGMTRVYTETGELIPVTVVQAEDCKVAQVKTKERDGYSSLQLSYGARKPQNVNKSKQGHFKKAGFAAKARLKELRVDDETTQTLKPGDTLSVDLFKKGDWVDVMGTSIGRGFTGVMKRHNFSGKNDSHGTHTYFRHGGSIGTNTFPGRVIKNVGMPGHYGSTRTTVQNLRIVDVDKKNGLLLIKGAIPGHKNGLVMIENAVKKAQPEKRSWT